MGQTLQVVKFIIELNHDVLCNISTTLSAWGWEGFGVGKIRTLSGNSRGLHVRDGGSVNVSEQNRKNRDLF